MVTQCHSDYKHNKNFSDTRVAKSEKDGTKAALLD